MEKKIKILRIITRLNIGGPSIHVSLLSHGLDPERFESILIGGKVPQIEGDMDYVARALGVRPVILSTLEREIKLSQDIKCLLELVRILDREKPDIVHTHTAKAGTLGRIAVFIHNRIRRRKILVVHTFHGHVLRGYFSSLKSAIFIHIERFLAYFTDKIIAVSEAVREDLIKFRIGSAEKNICIRLGLELDTFLDIEQKKPDSEGKSSLKMGVIGRLVPIKNHKLFLRAAKIFLGVYSL